MSTPKQLVSLITLCFSIACDEGRAPPRDPGDGGGGRGGAPADPEVPGPTEGPANDVDRVCALTRLACERQIACGHPVLNGAVDLEGCLATQGCESAAELLALPNVRLDPEALEACADAIERAACDALAAQGLGVEPACGRFVAGTLEAGAACHGGAVSDCAPGLTCDLEAGVCPGTCVEPTPPCAEGSCAPEDYCAADGTCRPRAPLGGSCDATTLDFDNLRDDACRPGAHCAEGVCEADLPRGAACLDADVHACGASGACRCEDPARCDDETPVCREAVAEQGGCFTSFDCAPGLHCDLESQRCSPRAGRGEACSDALGACAHPLACVAGTCGDEPTLPQEVDLLSEGDSCVGGGSCPLGTTCRCEDEGCASRRCLPAPRLGESCGASIGAGLDPAGCAEGMCDVYGDATCVLPGEPGAPCATEGLTMGCASLVCEAGRCASFVETRCEP